MQLYQEILLGVNILNGIKIQCPNVVISEAISLYYFRQETILNKIFLTVNYCSHFPELFCKPKINKPETVTSNTHTDSVCCQKQRLSLSLLPTAVYFFSVTYYASLGI
jgi:hypothetical protein